MKDDIQKEEFHLGAEEFKRKALKVINELSKEYDKSIDINHLKSEIKNIKVIRKI